MSGRNRAGPSPDAARGLWLHRSPRMEILVDRLLGALESQRVDPMRIYPVIVGSRGMARWLRHQIASRSGVCAGLDFPFIEHALLAALECVALEGAGIHEHHVRLHREGGRAPSGNRVEDANVAPRRTLLDGGARYGLTWAVLCAARTCWHHAEFAPVRDYLRALGSASTPGEVHEQYVHKRDMQGPDLDALGEPGALSRVDPHLWAWAAAVAGCFDRYALYRPQWLVTWAGAVASGLDHDQARQRSGAHHDLPPHLSWQRVLWQQIRAQMDRSTLAERIDELRRAPPHLLTSTEHAPLHVFGVSALGPSWLNALGVLARVRPVHLYAWVPTHDLIADAPALHRIELLAQQTRDGARQHVTRQGQGSDPETSQATMSATSTRNIPSSSAARSRGLLASCARVSRDFQLMLEDDALGVREEDPRLGALDIPDDFPGGRDDTPEDDADDGRRGRLSLLHAVVREVYGGDLRDQVSDGDRDSPRIDCDTSILILDAAGPLRQVEVLREALLHRFEQSPSLMPRDVLIMTPDLDTFAPLVDAIFSRPLPPASQTTARVGSPGELLAMPHAGLPVEIADLGLRNKNPAADLVLRVLELTQLRLTVPLVKDLMGNAYVRRRFELDDDDVAVASAWLVEAGIRWGWDAGERRQTRESGTASEANPTGAQLEPDRRVADSAAIQMSGSADRDDRLPPTDEDAHTWSAGLIALARGATITAREDALDDGVNAAGFAREGNHRLLGALLELCRRLHETIAELRRPATLQTWRTRIASVLSRFALAPPESSHLVAQVLGRCDDFLLAAQEASRYFESGAELPLDAGTLLLALREELEGSRESARTSAGGITMCALAPMRSVPFQVVCLLGLDESKFPRRSPRSSLDATLSAPALGDRDSLTEDRQLFLEALYSAREQLILTYSGRDPLTDANLPVPSVIEELCETVDRMQSRQRAAASASPPDSPIPARERLIRRTPLSPFSRRAFGAQLDAQQPDAQSRDTRKGRRPTSPPDFDPEFLAIAQRLDAPRAPRAGVMGLHAEAVLPPLDALAGLQPAATVGLARTPSARRIGPPSDANRDSDHGALVKEDSASTPLAAADDRCVTLQELSERLIAPARELLKHRVGISGDFLDGEMDASLPIELDRRQSVALRELILRSRLSAPLASPDALRQRLRAAGQLPLARAGDSVFAEILADVESCLDKHRETLSRPRGVVDLDLSLTGVRVFGRVEAVSDEGEILIITPRRSSDPRTLLAAWLGLLAIATQQPVRSHEAIILGLQAESGGGGLGARRMTMPVPSQLPALAQARRYIDASFHAAISSPGGVAVWGGTHGDDVAIGPEHGPGALLRSLAQLAMLSQRRALRWSLQASYAWAYVMYRDSLQPLERSWAEERNANVSRRARQAAQARWQDPRGGHGEGDEQAHRLLFPEHPPFAPVQESGQESGQESAPAPDHGTQPLRTLVSRDAEGLSVRDETVSREFAYLSELIWRPVLIALDHAKESRQSNRGANRGDAAAAAAIDDQATAPKTPRGKTKRVAARSKAGAEAAILDARSHKAPPRPTGEDA